MPLLITVAVIIALTAIYVLWLRPIFRDHPWFDPIYDWLEPIEARLWGKSRTIFVARALALAGYLITINDLLMPLVMVLPLDKMLPEPYGDAVGPVLMVVGHVFTALRKVTDTPLGEKE